MDFCEFGVWWLEFLKLVVVVVRSVCCGLVNLVCFCFLSVWFIKVCVVVVFFGRFGFWILYFDWFDWCWFCLLDWSLCLVCCVFGDWVYFVVLFRNWFLVVVVYFVLKIYLIVLYIWLVFFFLLRICLI